MKSFKLRNKKIIIITLSISAIALVAVALLCSHFVRLNYSESVPTGRIHDAGVFGDDVVIHDSTEGEIVIDVADNDTSITLQRMKLVSNPDDIWKDETYAGNHTPTQKAKMSDGSIGVLTIDKLNLSVNVFESESALEDMEKGVAHFPNTSAWDGNIGLSAHNVNYNLTDGYFKSIHTLKEGDLIYYKTELGERTYSVKNVSTIAASDWSSLNYQDFNQLTLITCISGQPSSRLCVTAVESSNI